MVPTNTVLIYSQQAASPRAAMAFSFLEIVARLKAKIHATLPHNLRGWMPLHHSVTHRHPESRFTV